jgi:polysaccharide pyruvyl transferase WcaK-like protein
MASIRNILVLNGDSTHNRGDGAILQGNIRLLRNVFPGAEVRALSGRPERDTEWYGIRFYKRGTLTEHVRAYRWADLIVWGGGELLQEDTSRVKIPYWFAHTRAASLLCPRIVAVGQGLGPIHSSANSLLCRLTIDGLKCYMARDTYSAEMLSSYGARTPIISSYDPAILATEELELSDAPLRAHLRERGFDPGDAPLVGCAPRRWFHQRSHWIPHKYAVRYRLRRVPGEDEYRTMVRNLAQSLDELVERHGSRIVFFAMYALPHEGDDRMIADIQRQMRHGAHTHALAPDLDPGRFYTFFSGLDFFLGIRLHSTILATSCLVPSATFYYAPKARDYFARLELPDNAIAIEELISTNGFPAALERLHRMVEEAPAQREHLARVLPRLRAALYDDGRRMRELLQDPHAAQPDRAAAPAPSVGA